ncbi:hypothetical protein ACP4OV_003153 [Aristida adscensionis]
MAQVPDPLAHLPSIDFNTEEPDLTAYTDVLDWLHHYKKPVNL